MGDEKKSRPYAGSGVSPDAYHAYGAVVGQLAQRNRAAAAGPQQTAPAPAKEKDGAKRTLELKQLLQQLRTSERGGLKGKLGLSNSDKFQEVMHAAEEVVEFISGRVGSNRKEAQSNAARLLRCYARMLDACEIYLARTARTGKGKARQNIVRQLRELAALDIDGARVAMDQVGTMSDDEIQGASWRDVLLRSRQYEVQLDVEFGQLGVTGGQASKVYKIPGAGGLSYFKEEENYHRVLDSEEKERDRVAVEVSRKIADQANLSARVRKILEESFGGDIRCIIENPEIWNKIGSDTDSVRKELVKFRDANQMKVSAAVKQAGLGFEIITSENRLNLRLDENKSANISRRNVATTRIADLLGIGDVIARSRTAKITDSAGNSMVGNLMEGAKGVVGSEALAMRVDRKAIAYAQRTGNYDVTKHNFDEYGSEMDFDQPVMQKGMTSLQVLDALCGQQDRHRENYLVELDEEGNAIGLKGIDNDFSFGRSDLDQASKGANRDLNSKLRDVVQQGQIVLPHMDKQLALNILALNDSTVKYALADLITQEEIDWFLRRLHDMQAALRKEMANKNSRVFVEKDSDWNRQTFEDIMAMRESVQMKKINDDYSNPEWKNILMAEPYLVSLNQVDGISASLIGEETKKIIAEMGAKKQAAQAGA